MIRICRICLVFAAAALLGGCSNGKFDCPAGKGIFCKPISQVDKMADRGQFSGKNRNTENKKTKKFFRAQHKTLKKQPLQLLSAAKAPPTRVPDKILQIWVAPFESADGVYHQPARMSVVVQKGSWAGQPFKYEEIK